MSEDRELILEISRNLQQLVERIDTLETRCQRIEIRLRDLGPPQVIPAAEYLPRG